MAMVVEPFSRDASRSDPNRPPQHMALHCVDRRPLPDAVQRFAQEPAVPGRFDALSVKRWGRNRPLRRGDTR